MEVLFHLIPGIVLFIFGLFTSDDYVAMGVYWLILGAIPVFIVVYNIIAFFFGLEYVFPEFGGGEDDRYSYDPGKIDYSCPTSAAYWLDEERYGLKSIFLGFNEF